MGWKKTVMIAAGAVAAGAAVFLVAVIRELGRFADDVSAFQDGEVDDDGTDRDK